MRLLQLLACAVAAMVLCSTSLAQWGLRFEVSKDGVAWSSSVKANAGETVKFRFGAYFSPMTKVTTADGTGNAIAMNRFTGQNQVLGMAAGDSIQNVQAAIQAFNASLLSVSGNLIGTTATTSFGAQLLLNLAPYAATPEFERPIYTGEIHVGSDSTYRQITISNKQFGSGTTPGLTFYHDLSIANRQSGKPDNAGAQVNFNATVIVGCPPLISSQPTDKQVCEGGSVVFSVGATNATGYQWRKDQNLSLIHI